MKFNVQAVKAAAEAEIERREEAARTRYVDAQAAYEERKAEWLASENPQIVLDAARAIVNKVRRGKVVVAQDAKVFERPFRSSESPLFTASPPDPASPVYQAKVEDLRDLVTFLDTVADEMVTASSLRDVGFRNVAAILRASA